MKAYALGRRSKWDYVDIYFFLESGLYLNEIIKRAETLFGKISFKKLDNRVKPLIGADYGKKSGSGDDQKN